MATPQDVKMNIKQNDDADGRFKKSKIFSIAKNICMMHIACVEMQTDREFHIIVYSMSWNNNELEN